MKVMTSMFAILALAFAMAAGIVLAQAQTDQRFQSATAEAAGQAKSVEEGEHPVLGKVLFRHVTCVHYAGVEMPANRDGSFGGWVAKNEGGVQETMTIYENYIVKEAVAPDGTTYRESHPYDTLGSVEQLIPASALKPSKAN